MNAKLIILFLFISTLVSAQITGKVTDTDNRPLKNVNVYAENTFNGTTTNANGEFKLDLKAEKNKVLQWYHLCDDVHHKYALLKQILTTQVETAIVFVKSRERLQQLKDKLASDGIDVCWLQGEMPQDKRMDAMARFKSKQVNILVATDVAARGIDVEEVSHVINFDMPRRADVYLHRIGRTARAGAKGTAISLVEAHDYWVLPKIERYIKEPLKARYIDGLRPLNKAPVIKKPKKSKVKDVVSAVSAPSALE